MPLPNLLRTKRYARTQVPSAHRLGSGYGALSYALRDEFATAADAGFSVPRACEPGPGEIIAVTDSDSSLSVASGALTFGGAGPSAYNSSRVTFTAQSRVAGKVLAFRATPAGTGGFSTAGWATANPATTTNIEGVLLNSGGQVRAFALAAGGLQLGTYAAAAQDFAVVLRATGHVLLQKVSGRWVVLYVHNALTTATLYPAILRHSNAVTYDNFRVLDNLWQHPVQCSDSFNRANGAIGTSDGAGTEETCPRTLDWTTLHGTLTVASNKAAFSALTSSKGLATMPGLADGILDCTVTTGAAAGGRPGVAFRVTDASNYWLARVDNNANVLEIVEVVAGSETVRANPAITVADSTSYRLFVTYDGASIQAFFNNTTRAAYASAATGLTATGVGLWTDTDVDVSFDGFSCKPRYVDSFGSLAG